MYSVVLSQHRESQIFFRTSIELIMSSILSVVLIMIPLQGISALYHYHYSNKVSRIYVHTGQCISFQLYTPFYQIKYFQ